MMKGGKNARARDITPCIKGLFFKSTWRSTAVCVIFVSWRRVLMTRKIDIKNLIYNGPVGSGCHWRTGDFKVSICTAKSPVPPGKQSISAKKHLRIDFSAFRERFPLICQAKARMWSFKQNLSVTTQVVNGTQLFDKQNEIERHRGHRN